ncbi:peptidylprolyl isomerase [Candidatus Micrarchaeota archaeon]|nr:peptidylprolyl isomerase [Candidatus Micrarchaeota archaeon]
MAESGDFVKAEYTGKRVADGRIFDCTSEKTAKEAGIYSEHMKYGPAVIILGKQTVIPGLDEALQNAKVGEQQTVEIPPEKAFGVRDPALVRVIPISEFKKQDIQPYPGMVLNLDNAPATVKSVSGGRVMVDLNHALAGDAVSYTFKITEKIEGTEAKAKALLENSSLNGEVKLSKEVLEAKFAPSVKKDSEFLMNKAGFVTAVLAFLPDVKKVSVIEEYEAGKTEEKEKK